MTKSGTPWPIVVKDGVQYVGTSRVRETSFAAREIQRVTGNPPDVEPDEFDRVTLHEPTVTRTVTFAVLGDPVAKGRPRASRTHTGIRMRTPAATKRYEEIVQSAARAAMGAGAPFRRPVSLRVEIYLPIPLSWSKVRQTKARIGVICATNKPDADNVLKAIKDGMNGIVYDDDSQVIAMTVTKKYALEPRVDVEAKEIDGEAA